MTHLREKALPRNPEAHFFLPSEVRVLSFEVLNMHPYSSTAVWVLECPLAEDEVAVPFEQRVGLDE